MKRALITGITGQDGAYLARFLLNQGYDVYGAYRRSASFNTWRLEELGVAQDVKLVALDLLEVTNILRVIERVRPDELYNLAAQSFVGLSFEQPIYTCEVDAIGVARLVEAVKSSHPATRFYQASTSEMFGKCAEVQLNEQTPFHPRSPYGVAKLFAHWITVNYREAYGLHASCGILFNHESPLRGDEFVTRKITSALARIRAEQQQVLELGNMDAKRDWGFAGDYVEAMWLMLQQPQPDDYVLGSDETHSVREFVEMAATAVGFNLEWEGEGTLTRGIDRRTGATIVRVNPEFYRPAEVDVLWSDATKARQTLDWRPTVTFPALVEMMVEADLRRATAGRADYQDALRRPPLSVVGAR